MVFIMAATIQAPAENKYTPPSDKELLAWFDSLPPADKAAELRKLDIIEHSIPDIIFPRYAVLMFKDGDLVLNPLSTMSVTIDYLAYDVTLPVITIKNFNPEGPPAFSSYLVTSFISALAGFLIGLAF